MGENFKNRLSRAFPVFSNMLSGSKPPILQQGVTGGIAGDHAFSKVKKEDQLIGMMHHSTAALSADLTDEFEITGDGVISNTGGTDTSADFIIATWLAWDNS